jgi:hypothetical protein
VVHDDLGQVVHDLTFQLVAHHLLDLARIGERQVEHTQGEHLTGQRHVNGRSGGQTRQTRAQRLGLSFSQRSLAGRHGLLEGGVDAHTAESHVKNRELDRPRSQVDSGDSVSHNSLASLLLFSPVLNHARGPLGLDGVVGDGVGRHALALSRMTMILFLTLPDSPVATTRYTRGASTYATASSCFLVMVIPVKFCMSW